MNFLLPTELLENFHFLRPLFLLGLIPAFILFVLLRYLQGANSNWTRAIDPSLLPYLLDRKLGARQSYPLYGLLLLWALGFAAMAGPTWRQIPVPVQEREDAVVMVLDLSQSMYATDLRPDRITRARRKVMDLLDARRQEGETALVVYAGTAHAVTPLTDDVETIGNLVPSLQPSIMPAPGSRPAAGVNLALDLLKQSNLTEGHIILLTDGIQQSDIGAIDELLRGTGHRLSVLGFGTEEGAPIPLGQQGFLRDANNAIVIPRLDRAPLQQLASDNGGRYSDARINDEDITLLLTNTRLRENENLVRAQDREFDTWDDVGPWLILLLLPFAALSFRRGWLLGLVLGFALMSPPKPAYAAIEWQDLWVNKNNQGQRAFDSEAYGEAAGDFQDPNWRAAANYRNQNFEATASELASIDTPEANYNRGNALAHMQQYEAAIAAYDRTLSTEPDNADALHNKELVQKLLDEQQQQQQEQQQGQGDQQQQDQQNGEQQDQQGEQSQQQQNQAQQQQSQQQQDGQQNQEQQDQNQEQQEQQAENDKKDNEQESEQEQEQQLSDSQPSAEEQQAMQQWLMRIPDDPGELLRNKFQYQTQQRLLQRLQNPALDQPQSGDPLW
jgi:Ca-activated chloride channel family protein